LGRITKEKTIPQLIQFLNKGGTVLTIGSSTRLADYLDLPIADALVEKAADGSERPIPREKYYVPGSVLQAKVDNRHPLAFGMPETADVFFRFSPVFRLFPEAPSKGVKPVAWFGEGRPLRSGWAWGQHHLSGGVLVVEVDVGRGKLFLYGPEITFRAQPHGTFKFLFNGIYYGGAEFRQSLD
jgi:hypothetical protein